MGMMVLGALLIVAGFALRYSYGRQRYYKKFAPMKMVSYERKLISNAGQELKYFFYIAFLIVGLILLVMGYIVHKDPHANDLKNGPTTYARH